MEIYIVPTSDIDLIWGDHASGFQKACDAANDPGYAAGDLWQMCRSGFAFLVVCEDYGQTICASIWRFERPEKPTQFRCKAIYGQDMKQWLGPLREFVSKIAIENGAVELAASGRQKWARLFKDAKFRGDEMVLELNK